MKKIILSLVAVLSTVVMYAQLPQAFKYQAVVRNNSGNVLTNQNVSFRISILQDSTMGYASLTRFNRKETNRCY